MRDDWDFPVGTLLFKTFSYKDPAQGGPATRSRPASSAGSADTGNPEIQWEFHVWEWNAEGTAATLLDGRRRTPREVSVGGQTITHNIPPARRLLELPHRQQVARHRLR